MTVTCTHCDHCPTPIVLAPRAFRRVSERVNSLAQRLELAEEQDDWQQVGRVKHGITTLLSDLHLCRVGECPCEGRNRMLKGQHVDERA